MLQGYTMKTVISAHVGNARIFKAGTRTGELSYNFIPTLDFNFGDMHRLIFHRITHYQFNPEKHGLDVGESVEFYVKTPNKDFTPRYILTRKSENVYTVRAKYVYQAGMRRMVIRTWES